MRCSRAATHLRRGRKLYNRPSSPSSSPSRSAAVQDPLNDRLTELEIRVAFQDDLLGALNGQVATLSSDMRFAQREIARLREALDGLRTSLAHDVADEPPPPHY